MFLRTHVKLLETAVRRFDGGGGKYNIDGCTSACWINYRKCDAHDTGRLFFKKNNFDRQERLNSRTNRCCTSIVHDVKYYEILSILFLFLRCQTGTFRRRLAKN